MGNVCQKKESKIISVNIDITACKWLANVEIVYREVS